jgi:hypothetical protein
MRRRLLTGLAAFFGGQSLVWPQITQLPSPPLATKQVELFKRDFETTMGLPNGTLQTFNLTYTPNGGSRLQLFRNGILQREGSDYTLCNGKQICFLAIPQAGDLLTADYYVVLTV